MRIVLTTNHLPPHELGGVGLFSRNLAFALLQAGHEVVLLTGSSHGVRGGARLEQIAAAAPGVRTLRLLRGVDAQQTALGQLVHSFLDARAEALLQQVLQDLAPDLVHVQHTLNLSVRLPELARRCGAKLVGTLHDFWPICQRVTLRHAEGGICQGPAGGLACAGCLAEPDVTRASQHPGVKRLWTRTRRSLEIGSRVGPYALRTQMVGGAYARLPLLTYPAPFMAGLFENHGFRRARLRQVDYGVPELDRAVVRLDRPRRLLRFGFLGTMGPHKGLLVALRAAEQLQHGSWKLLVYGGPLRDRHLRQRLDPGQVGGLWEYRGPYAPGEVSRILANLDAVIIPSLWPETGPLVWMEAVRAGLPVIASRIGALAERVRHGVDGLLFEPGDPNALAGAMAQLIEDYARLRQGALEREVPTMLQIAQRHLEIYAEALSLS